MSKRTPGASIRSDCVLEIDLPPLPTPLLTVPYFTSLRMLRSGTYHLTPLVKSAHGSRESCSTQMIFAFALS